MAQAGFISAAQMPMGSRKRPALAGPADADVKAIPETLEKELGAVLR